SACSLCFKPNQTAQPLLIFYFLHLIRLRPNRFTRSPTAACQLQCPPVHPRPSIIYNLLFALRNPNSAPTSPVHIRCPCPCRSCVGHPFLSVDCSQADLALAYQMVQCADQSFPCYPVELSIGRPTT